MQKTGPKLLSIIIPVYKQENTIAKELKYISAEMELLHIPYELIVVVDGNVDKSRNEANKVKSSRILVVGYETNHGKGYAVRYGMSKSKGDIVGFIDSGGDLQITSLPLMIEHMKWYNADIIIGSKRHPVSKVNYPLPRKFMSFFYQIFIRFLFGLNVRDTQVGMKLFQRHVLEDVFPRLLVKKFAFDIEILAVANHLGYQRIYEAPVILDFSSVSSITNKNFWRIVLNMIRDTLAVFYRLKILHYYDAANKRKWRFDPQLNFRVNVG